MPWTIHYLEPLSAASVAATSQGSPYYMAWFALDPSRSLAGGSMYTCWFAGELTANIKYNIDLGAAWPVTRLRIDNMHENGYFTTQGVRNVAVYGTNSAEAFANTDYADTTDLTLLATIEVAQHVAADSADPQYFQWENATPYRYVVLRIADNWGASMAGFRRIEVMSMVMLTITSALVGQYSMVLEQALVGRYGNATMVQAGIIGRYGDAAHVQAALIGRYGDMVPVLAALEGRYHLMHSVVAGLVGQYAICGAEVLAGLVGRYDLKERNEIMAALEGYYSLLPAATIAHITCPVRIGGVAVRWSSVSWTVSEDSYLIEATITLRDPAEFGSIAKMDTVEIDWGGTTYQLFVAAKLRSRSISGDAGSAEYGADYTIVARSLSAGLDAPYALPVTMSWPATTLASVIASELIASLADIITLDFRLEDWLQPGGTFFLTDESPLDGLRKLAAIVGGIVQTSPGNAVILRMADATPPAQWATTTPAWTIEDSGLFSDSESEADSNRYNVITVTNQSESDTSTRFEVEDITEYRKRVRGYRVPWEDFALATSGGSWVTIEDNGVIEEQIANELVEFIDGSASSTKPIYSQVAATWKQSSLGGITAAEDGSLTAEVTGNSLATVTYTTRYHEWIVTSDRAEEVQFYEAEA